MTAECLDEDDFQTGLEDSNYKEMVTWALNFNCYNPTTYAVPGVPISNTSCDNISFIDDLLPSKIAGELNIHVFVSYKGIITFPLKFLKDVGMTVLKSRETSAVYIAICSKTGDEGSIYAARQGMQQ